MVFARDLPLAALSRFAGSTLIPAEEQHVLDMPAMTMTYRENDKAVLAQLKPGDKIKFDVDGAGSEFTVLHLEKVK